MAEILREGGEGGEGGENRLNIASQKKQNARKKWGRVCTNRHNVNDYIYI